MKSFINIIIIVFLFCDSANSQWVAQTSGSNLIISSVYFVNSSTGFACCEGGGPGLVLKTTNGGTNWISIFTGFNYDLTGVCFTSVNTGYLSNVDSHVLKTTNAGFNWFMLSNPSMGIDLAAIDFPDSLNGYTVGGVNDDHGVIYKTTNAGETWTWVRYGASTTYGHYCLDFLDANTGYVGGMTSLNGVSDVIKTTDGGATWSRRLSITSGEVTGISFSDYNNGYLISALGEIYYTTDAGVYWIYSANLPNGLDCVKDFNPDTAYISGTQNLIARTVNHGITWDIQTPYITGGNAGLVAMFFPNNTIGYAVGDSGRILKTTDAGVIGIQTITSIIPGSYMLYQNYPNPFNPLTNIRVDIVKDSKVNLTIYDMLGREVAVLINQQLKSGTYKVDWNAANYPSGIYFYKLVTNDFNETKKMILIK